MTPLGRIGLAGFLLSAAGVLLSPRTNVSAAENCFIRGDADADGSLSISDAIRVLKFVFSDGTGVTCLDAADVDDSGSVESTDPVLLLNYLFRRGRQILPPSRFCSGDPTPDELGCAGPTSCTTGFFGLEIDTAVKAVFFVIDRSGSMQDRGELQIARSSLVCTIASFPDDFDFGVVFFDSTLLTFPSSGSPARATEEMKEDAIAWVLSIPGGSGSCVQQALVEAINMAGNSSAEEKVIYYVGDGGGTCLGANETTYLEQTLEVVDAQIGAEAITIHTIGLLDVRFVQENFLRELAERNGGEFLHVVR